MVPMKRVAQRNPSRPAVTGLKSPTSLLNAAANENIGSMAVTKPNPFVNARTYSILSYFLEFLLSEMTVMMCAIIFIC